MAAGGYEHVSVPTTIAIDVPAQMLVTDAFSGPTIADVVANGQPVRAAQLVAGWFIDVAPAKLSIGKTVDDDAMISKLRANTAQLADATLASRLCRVLDVLESKRPDRQTLGLAHGSFKLDHLHDCGSAVGVIDWDGYFHGAVEHDAGTFLATATRLAIESPPLESAMKEARNAFCAAVDGVLHRPAVTWYEARAFGKIVCKLSRAQTPGWQHIADHVLDHAESLVNSPDVMA
jgi:hypothetical protein